MKENLPPIKALETGTFGDIVFAVHVSADPIGGAGK